MNIAQFFTKYYSDFLKGMHTFTSVVLTFFFNVFVSIGVPVLGLVLGYLEYERLRYGVAIFEVHPALASFGAFGLVMLAATIEFLRVNYSASEGHDITKKNQKRLSLITLLTGVLRFLGVIKVFTVIARLFGYYIEDEDEYQSRLDKLTAFQGLIMVAYLLLAWAGSIFDYILQNPETYNNVAWHEAFISLFVDGDLETVLTWSSSLAFALVAYVGLIKITEFIATRAMQSMSQIETTRQEIEEQEAGIVSLSEFYKQQRQDIKNKLREYQSVAHHEDKVQYKNNKYSFYDSEQDEWTKPVSTKTVFMSKVYEILAERQ